MPVEPPPPTAEKLCEGERPFSPPPAKLGVGREAVGWGKGLFSLCQGGGVNNGLSPPPSLPQLLTL